MCYGTRVVRKADQLELFYNVERLYGELDPGTELVYNFANGFAHPPMWILPQERKKNLIPVMWG